MARFGYSVIGLDPDKTVKASIREEDISFKHTREIATHIKGMLVERAKEYLEDVIAMKRSVPFRRYNKKVGHRSDLKGWDSGRYPVKAAERVLLLLESLEKNATNKGLEVDRLFIIHAVAQRGRKMKRIFSRAYGSTSAKVKTLTHLELIAEEA
ncbi:MAG: 50S ribosomal protein L22 [Candidatus Kariarchaeaceae archaeon]|jgi:large subunit ribosomal protein L22